MQSSVRQMQRCQAPGGKVSRVSAVRVRAVLAVRDAPVEAPASAQRAAHVRVGLKLPYKPPPGQSLGVVGSAHVLGAWQPEHALKLFPNGTNDIWQIDFLVDPSDPPLEYKYVLLDGSDKVVAWAKDPNRKLEVASLQGSAISVSEQWEPGPREIRLVVGLQEPSAAAGGGNGLGALGGGNGAPPPAVVLDAEHAAALRIVQGQVKAITAKLSQTESLKLDVARLVAAGPLPPFVSAKQLTDLAQQLTAFEDVKDMVAEFAAAGTAVLMRLSTEQLLDVSDKLDMFSDLEDSLSTLVGQLASRGGCPVGYSVGKSIALAAENRTPMHHRPYRW